MAGETDNGNQRGTVFLNNQLHSVGSMSGVQ